MTWHIQKEGILGSVSYRGISVVHRCGRRKWNGKGWARFTPVLVERFTSVCAKGLRVLPDFSLLLEFLHTERKENKATENPKA
jgi:hypothetical protein